MNKTLVIAIREYRAAVRTKAFVIGLVVMPVLMAGAIVVQLAMKDKVDTSTKRFVVVDRTGQLEPAITSELKQYNERDVFEGEGEDRKQTRPQFEIEFAAPGDSQKMGAELSDRVRAQEIYAYLNIGPKVISGGPSAEGSQVSYHSQNPVDGEFRNWVTGVLNREVHRMRAEKAGVDQETVEEVTRQVPVANRGLAELDETTGEISEAKEANILAHMFVPMGLMMLVFLAVMVGATPLVQVVQEEKQARISEVLLGCARPFQLMLGKLVGTVGVSITSVSVYLVGGFVTLKIMGYDEYFPSADVIVWLFVFQSLAVLMFGSLFIAVGAAVTDMREAQSMMMPVMIFAMAPMFIWFQVVREPTSTMSVALSLFPPATPMLMLLRLAAPQEVPLWQPILGVALVLLSTMGCVYVAARIFRIGILMQGKGANLRQLASWVVRG